jgi:alpha-D-ribose 1-methylphosphonate 5-triphosphate synthase subunit PhnG
MKTLLIVAVLGAGVWYLMTRAKENAAVKQMADAPLQYTKSLQNDTVRAKAVMEAANKGIQQENQEVQKTVEAAQ